MNRYLLAGCAAVALAMGSGAANAQAKFEVKVGGDVFFEAGYISQDNDTGLRSTEMRNRFRLNIVPSAKADNGLEYGARIRIRSDWSRSPSAGQSADGLRQDRAYIFVQGGFGQFRLGNTNTFNDETIVSRPIDYLPFGLFDQALSYPGGRSATTAQQGADIANASSLGLNGASVVWPTFGDVATRIAYFSPRFAGFQLGLSYAPRNDDSNNSIARSKGSNLLTTATAASAMQLSMQDLTEVGLNYSGEFSGVTVKGGAGYYWGKASDVAGASFKDMNAWQLGGQVGYAGFVLGASYTDFGKSGLNKSSIVAPFKDNASVWQVGAQYTAGPIVVGAGWMRGEDSGSVAVSGKRKTDVYEIGASYTVAPGLAVQAQYDYYKANSDLPTTAALGDPDDKGSIVLLRTTLAF